MGKWILVLAGLAAAMIFSLVAASRFLSWWAVLGIALIELAALLAASRFLGRRLLYRIGRTLFEAKSRALRDASCQVDTVRILERAPDSDDDPVLAGEKENEDEEEENEAAFWVEVVCTIEPKPSNQTPAASDDLAMTHWDPYDFVLVPSGTDLSGIDEHSPEGWLESVQCLEPLIPGDEFDKLQGKARLRFVFACPAELPRDVVLRYYFEGLTSFRLPDPVQKRSEF